MRFRTLHKCCRISVDIIFISTTLCNYVYEYWSDHINLDYYYSTILHSKGYQYYPLLKIMYLLSIITGDT